MLLTHIVVAVLWILYGVAHSALAAAGTKNFFKKRFSRLCKHYRFAYNILALLGLAGIVAFQFSIASHYLFTPATFSKITGAAIALIGLGLMLVCVKKYFIGLSGLKSLVREEVYQELLITGVHRYVRHPLYLGTFIFLWGLAVVFPSISLVISNTVITIYTMIGIRLEEQKLVADFGDAYRTYQQQVPKLLPKFSAVENIAQHHRQKASIGR